MQVEVDFYAQVDGVNFDRDYFLRARAMCCGVKLDSVRRGADEIEKAKQLFAEGKKKQEESLEQSAFQQ